MEPENLYPNDSSNYFGIPVEPQDQAVERKKEKAATLKEINVLRELIKRFDERIEYRDRISALRVDLKESPEMHQKKCEVNDMLRLALIEEKQWLEDLLEAHAKNR